MANGQNPQRQQGPGQQRRQPQPQQPRVTATYRLAVVEIAESPTRVTVKARLYRDDFTDGRLTGSQLIAGESVMFFVDGGLQLAMVTDLANGEVAFAHDKLAGQTQATLRLVAQVVGNPQWEQTVKFKQIVPVPATPPAPPKPTEPDLVALCINRHLHEDGSWSVKVAASTEDAQLIVGHAAVTFVGPDGQQVAVPFDAQGTAWHFFQGIGIDVAEVTFLVSISAKPWQKTVTVLRPTEEATIEVLLREKYWQDETTAVVAVRALVKQTRWRDGRVLRLWIQGVPAVTMQTVNGVAEHVFGIPAQMVHNLGTEITFGALMMATGAQDRRSEQFPVWVPPVDSEAHEQGVHRWAPDWTSMNLAQLVRATPAAYGNLALLLVCGLGHFVLAGILGAVSPLPFVFWNPTVAAFGGLILWLVFSQLRRVVPPADLLAGARILGVAVAMAELVAFIAPRLV